MKKIIKVYEELDKVFTVKDKVSGSVRAVYMAKNEKDMVRTLAFMGYWKVERWIDTEIYETGYIVESDGSITGLNKFKKVDLEKVARELSIQLESEAKPINEKKEDIEKALQNNNIDIVKNDKVQSKEEK